ncbi:hypothetical protein F5146DRAFT_1122080 [Armillaria mellea]|nr:hypothetical protein F5146DRAFT_1122080 [Armillaria mellea]
MFFFRACSLNKDTDHQRPSCHKIEYLASHKSMDRGGSAEFRPEILSPHIEGTGEFMTPMKLYGHAVCRRDSSLRGPAPREINDALKSELQHTRAWSVALALRRDEADMGTPEKKQNHGQVNVGGALIIAIFYSRNYAFHQVQLPGSPWTRSSSAEYFPRLLLVVDNVEVGTGCEVKIFTLQKDGGRRATICSERRRTGKFDGGQQFGASVNGLWEIFKALSRSQPLPTLQYKSPYASSTSLRDEWLLSSTSETPAIKQVLHALDDPTFPQGDVFSPREFGKACDLPGAVFLPSTAICDLFLSISHKDGTSLPVARCLISSGEQTWQQEWEQFWLEATYPRPASKVKMGRGGDIAGDPYSDARQHDVECSTSHRDNVSSSDEQGQHLSGVGAKCDPLKKIATKVEDTI